MRARGTEGPAGGDGPGAADDRGDLGRDRHSPVGAQRRGVGELVQPARDAARRPTQPPVGAEQHDAGRLVDRLPRPRAREPDAAERVAQRRPEHGDERHLLGRERRVAHTAVQDHEPPRRRPDAQRGTQLVAEALHAVDQLVAQAGAGRPAVASNSVPTCCGDCAPARRGAGSPRGGTPPPRTARRRPPRCSPRVTARSPAASPGPRPTRRPRRGAPPCAGAGRRRRGTRGRGPWNLAVDQHPAVVVEPASTDDVRVVMRFARSTGLPVAVQTTGHGVTVAGDGGVLVRTGRLDTVTIDAPRRVAHVGGRDVGTRAGGGAGTRARTAARVGAARRRGRLHPGRRARLAGPAPRPRGRPGRVLRAGDTGRARAPRRPHARPRRVRRAAGRGHRLSRHRDRHAAGARAGEHGDRRFAAVPPRARDGGDAALPGLDRGRARRAHVGGRDHELPAPRAGARRRPRSVVRHRARLPLR